MRALLVVNPMATMTTTRSRNVLTSALGSGLQLDVEPTKARGHARELGEQAVDARYDVVVALGGDGTVNEVINGLLARGPSPSVPALAIVPGGSTNVFARALGITNHPVDATSELLDALREGRSRRIGLGQADGRWFTFSAGLGLDAATVRQVEDKCQQGRRKTSALYIRCALREFYRFDRRHPQLTLSAPGIADQRLILGLVTNTDPWTFVNDKPLRPTPYASLTAGLDVLGMCSLGTVTALGTLARWYAREPRPHGRHTMGLHDQTELTLRADGPLPFQLDGEPLGDRTSVHFRGVPNALRIVA